MKVRWRESECTRWGRATAKVREVGGGSVDRRYCIDCVAVVDHADYCDREVYYYNYEEKKFAYTICI